MPPQRQGRAPVTVTRQVTDWSRGINRTADRHALEDNEAWWLENLQPIGPGTLRAAPARC
jgi:hypothetical protein